MNSQNFTLLVFVAIIVFFVWRVVSGSRRKQEIEMEERESPQECRKERYAPEDNEHYVSEDGDVEYFPFRSDSQFEGIEIRGLNSYYRRLGIPRPQHVTRGNGALYGSDSGAGDDLDWDRNAVGADDLDRDVDDDREWGADSDRDWDRDVDDDTDGDADDNDDWDRDEAVAAAQANLRLMREEDLNYAMDSIEAEILNMDHAPGEDELIDIADRAADAYDMSEDYRDY